MNEHLKKSEAELNELLAEYWKLRRETGEYICVLVIAAVQAGILHRCVYGNAGKQAEHACHIRMTHVCTYLVVTCLIECNLSPLLLYLRFTTLPHPNVRVRQSLRL